MIGRRILSPGWKADVHIWLYSVVRGLEHTLHAAITSRSNVGRRGRRRAVLNRVCPRKDHGRLLRGDKFEEGRNGILRTARGQGLRVGQESRTTQRAKRSRVVLIMHSNVGSVEDVV